MSADADPSQIHTGSRDLDLASFEAGVAACRAALANEFGAEAGFTHRLMGIIDIVELKETMSRTLKIRPNPGIIPLPGAKNG